MPGEATTVRFDPEVKNGLNLLSKVTDQSVNKLVNKAAKELIAKLSLEVERDLESTLKDLRSLRQNDPNFERAIVQLAEAEATIDHDPSEGHATSEVGPTETALLKLLNG